jgi:hypothetical protein
MLHRLQLLCPLGLEYLRQGYALHHTVVLVGVLGLWRHWPFDTGGQSEGKNQLQKRDSGSRCEVDGHDYLRIRDLDQAGDLELHFGSLHGSVFTEDGGTCKVLGHIVKRVCSLDLELVRTTEWYLGIAWFALYLGISIMLQIAGAKVATVLLEAMAVIILTLTSVFRG